MKIDGWFIDGFGHFHAQTQGPLSPGMTVFLGPNEAGKSTLLGFIRAMLFGFPARNASEARYDPLHGGRHGGRLILSTPLGPYTVQRYADKREPFTLWRPDASEGSESELQQLLGYADPRLFKSIFAFSLSELSNAKLHKEDGIRDRIFSGSLQGARNSAREALSLLAKQNEPVHKLKARNSELITLAERIESQRERIREARRESQRYDALVTEERRLSDAIAELSDAQGRGLLEIQRAETLLSLWPLWHERKGLQSALDGMEAVDRFPEQAEARLAALLARVEESEKALAERELERAELEQRLNAVVLDEPLALRAAPVLHWHAERSRFQEWEQQRLEDAERRKEAERALDEALTLLGSGWTRARLVVFDASLIRLDEVRAWGDRLRLALEREQDAARMLKDQQLRRDEAEARLALHLKQLDALGPCLSEAELLARDEGLVRLRTALAERKGAQEAWEHARERLEALELEQGRVAMSAARRLPAAIRMLLWLGALLVLGLAAWIGLTDRVMVGVLLAGVALAFAALTFVRLGPGVEALRAAEGLEQRLREQREQVIRCQETLGALETTLRRAAETLGFTALPSLYEVESVAQRGLRERESARQVAQGRLEAERLHGECQEVGATCEAAERVVSEAQAERRRLEAEWRDYCQALGMPDVTSPQGMTEVFQQVGRARQRVQELSAHEERDRALAEKLEGFRDGVAALLKELDEPAPTGDAGLIQALERLHERVRAHQSAQQRGIELREALESQALRLEAQARDLSEARAALEALYVEGGARDRGEFERRSSVHQERVEVKRALLRLDGELDARLGEGPKAEALRQELATGDVEGWKAQIAKAQEAREALDRQRDALNQQVGELQTERRTLEEASDVIAREHEHQALLDEFRRLAREWQVRALAEGMITETLKELERTRQPVVLAHAAELFAHVSEGRYPRLLQAEGGDFRIEDATGGRREVSALSRGTSEQLYLCIRLGLVKEFARQSANLPLVMDDVFVNFDPERARRMAEMLVRFAAEHQVLLFTCHPGTAELLGEVDPGLEVVHLPRYGEALPAREEVQGRVPVQPG